MIQDTRERYINPYTDFGFKKLFEQAEIARYSETERRQYEESKKVFWDNYSVIKTAELKGEKRGEKKGREEGRKEGEIKGKKEIARKMKADGLPNEVIAKYTGLSADEIEQM